MAREAGETRSARRDEDVHRQPRPRARAGGDPRMGRPLPGEGGEGETRLGPRAEARAGAFPNGLLLGGRRRGACDCPSRGDAEVSD